MVLRGGGLVGRWNWYFCAWVGWIVLLGLGWWGLGGCCISLVWFGVCCVGLFVVCFGCVIGMFVFCGWGLGVGFCV